MDCGWGAKRVKKGGRCLRAVAVAGGVLVSSVVRDA